MTVGWRRIEIRRRACCNIVNHSDSENCLVRGHMRQHMCRMETKKANAVFRHWMYRKFGLGVLVLLAIMSAPDRMVAASAVGSQRQSGNVYGFAPPQSEVMTLGVDGSGAREVATWGLVAGPFLPETASDEEILAQSLPYGSQVMVNVADMQYMGAIGSNSYLGELSAMVWALMYVLTQLQQRPTTESVKFRIVYDSTSVVQVVVGKRSATSGQLWVAVAQALWQQAHSMLWSRHCQVVFEHAKAHTGHLINEEADRISNVVDGIQQAMFVPSEAVLRLVYTIIRTGGVRGHWSIDPAVASLVVAVHSPSNECCFAATNVWAVPSDSSDTEDEHLLQAANIRDSQSAAAQQVVSSSASCDDDSGQHGLVSVPQKRRKLQHRPLDAPSIMLQMEMSASSWSDVIAMRSECRTVAHFLAADQCNVLLVLEYLSS